MSEPTITVDAEALRQVLQALIGPPHHARELQATRSLHKLGHANPIETLVEQYQAWCDLPGEARAQPAQEVPLHQALTDPENQPNQYGIQFLMHGPRMAFKIGSQQFDLAHEPTEPGEFEFMRDALIRAFAVFTPDGKTAQEVPKLTDDDVHYILLQHGRGTNIGLIRAAEAKLREKMGATNG